MGALYDLKESIATKLKANVTELADVDVIAYRGRDLQQRVSLALQKVAGLAVVVALTGGDNDEEGDSRRGNMGLRLESAVSVTLWSVPTMVTDTATSAPLTSGSRQPDDVLEAMLKCLHNLDVNDVGNLEGGPGTLQVTGWELINSDPPFHVHEIRGQIITQLPI